MGLKIANNITALTALRNLGSTDKKIGSVMEKLSSGYRINRAADDPAGLAISQKMRAQIAGLNQAMKNAETGVSMVQTAEAALAEVHDLLTTMRELVIHSANEAANDQTMLDADQAQIDQIINTINRISANTEFGTLKLLDGNFANAIVDGQQSSLAGQGLSWDGSIRSSVNKAAVFHVGASANQVVSIAIANIGASFLGTNGTQDNTAGASSDTRRTGHYNATAVLRTGTSLNSVSGSNGVSNRGVVGSGSVQNIQDIAINLSDDVADQRTTTTVTSQDVRNDALRVISLAIGEISTVRNNLGSFQSFNLETNIRSTRMTVENLINAESIIRDTDMAQEMAEFTKMQIMMQVNTSMLAQANTLPQGILQLLG